jgi:hypothetical protein
MHGAILHPPIRLHGVGLKLSSECVFMAWYLFKHRDNFTFKKFICTSEYCYVERKFQTIHILAPVCYGCLLNVR